MFNCSFYRSLDFLVTFVRVECCVVFIVRLCLLYNFMCNNAFETERMTVQTRPEKTTETRTAIFVRRRIRVATYYGRKCVAAVLFHNFPSLCVVPSVL